LNEFKSKAETALLFAETWISTSMLKLSNNSFESIKIVKLYSRIWIYNFFSPMTLHTQLDWHCHFVQFSYVQFVYTIYCLYYVHNLNFKICNFSQENLELEKKNSDLHKCLLEEINTNFSSASASSSSASSQRSLSGP
jgi:hypothetical protein